MGSIVSDQFSSLLIAGAGRAGLNIAARAAKCGLAVRLWDINVPAEPFTAAAQALALPIIVASAPPALLPGEFTLVCVPDGSIDGAVEALEADQPRRPMAVVSGNAPLPRTKEGEELLRFHPAFSFPTPALPDLLLDRVTVVASGPQSAMPAARWLAQRLQWGLVEVQQLDTLPYHTACVFASNLTSACLASASSLLQGAGFNPLQAQAVLSSLLTTPSSDLRPLDAPQRFSGPASRHDTQTLNRESQMLRQRLPEAEQLFISGNLLISEMSKKPSV